MESNLDIFNTNNYRPKIKETILSYGKSGYELIIFDSPIKEEVEKAKKWFEDYLYYLC